MIGILFQLASDIFEVRVDGKNVWFRTAGSNFVTIDGLMLNKSGVIKEHPDLKDSSDWQSIARQRFKDKMNTMETEENIADYIIQDLTKLGYKPLWKQKQGYRVEKLC
jgi:hypothetical protein